MDSNQVRPQTQMMLPPGTQVLAANSVPQQTNAADHYAVKCVSILAIVQITIGILCLILQIASIAIHAQAAEVGSGIWCGILFILAGVLGVWSSKSKTSCAIVSFLVMSIISAVFTVAVISACSITWAFESDGYRYGYPYGRSRTSLQNARIALNACMVVLAIIEGIVAIISSAMACHGLCCGKQQPGVVLVPGQIQYTQGADGQQSIIIIPANQQIVTMPTAPQVMAGVTLQAQPQPQPYTVLQGGSNVQPVSPPAYNQAGAPATPPPVYGYDHQYGDERKEKP